MGVEPAPPEDWEEVPTQVQLGWLGGGVPEPELAPGEGAEQLADPEEPEPRRGPLGLPGQVDRRIAPDRSEHDELRDNLGFVGAGPTSVRTAPSTAESGWNPLGEPVPYQDLESPKAPTPMPPSDSFAGRRSLAYRRAVPSPTPARHKKRETLPHEMPARPMTQLDQVDENLRSRVQRPPWWRVQIRMPRWTMAPSDVAAFSLVFASTLLLGLIAIWLFLG